MRIWKDENGQVLVFVALSMTILLGFTALAVDIGTLFRAKRNLQIAADAGAVAAALDYYYTASKSSAVAAGKAAVTSNGVTNGTGGAVVTVNSPPASGPNAASAGFFEVLVSQPNPTAFMRVITNTASVSVAGRAVAGTPSASNTCMYIGKPTGAAALQLQGNSTINAANCGIYVNSNNSGAVKVTGNSNSVTATSFNVNGGFSGHQTSPTTITTNAPAMSNPLGNITGPIPPGGCTTTNASTSLSGSYTAPGGLVCFTKAVTLTNGTTLGSGLYVFENGVTIPPGATVTVNGGTLDLYGVGSSAGTLNQASNSILNITAPTTSGTYNGIAILQPASNTTDLQVQFGSNNETLDGLIYAPGAKVSLQDNGGGVTASGVFANTMFIKSSTLNIPSYSAAHPTTTPLKQVSLVE